MNKRSATDGSASPLAIRSIVAPVDGGALSERALATAIALGELLNARVHPLFVHVPLPPGLHVPGTFDSVANIERSLLSDGQKYVRQVEERFRTSRGDLVPVTLLRSRAASSPFGEAAIVAQAIKRFATERKADMLVMSSHGAGGVSRAWLGSVTDLAIRQLNIPILVLRAPRENSDASFRHVLVPLDGSAWSEQILPMALAVVAACSARVTVLQAWKSPENRTVKRPPIRVDHTDVHTRELRRRMRELQARLPQLRKAGVVAVAAKSPARGILRFAEQNDVDLIAMTTRGRGGAARLMLGSVADKVVRGSACATLVLKPTTK